MTNKKLVQNAYKALIDKGYKFVVYPNSKIMAVERGSKTLYIPDNFIGEYHECCEISSKSGVSVEEAFAYRYHTIHKTGWGYGK